MIKSKGRYFFPDFIINDEIIIDCTAWRGFDKATNKREDKNSKKQIQSVYCNSKSFK